MSKSNLPTQLPASDRDMKLSVLNQQQMDRITDAGESQEVAMLMCNGMDLAAVISLMVDKGVCTTTEVLQRMLERRTATIDEMEKANEADPDDEPVDGPPANKPIN